MLWKLRSFENVRTERNKRLFNMSATLRQRCADTLGAGSRCKGTTFFWIKQSFYEFLAKFGKIKTIQPTGLDSFDISQRMFKQSSSLAINYNSSCWRSWASAAAARAACNAAYSSALCTEICWKSRRPVPAGIKLPQITFSFIPSK